MPVLGCEVERRDPTRIGRLDIDSLPKKGFHSEKIAVCCSVSQLLFRIGYATAEKNEGE